MFRPKNRIAEHIDAPVSTAERTSPEPGPYRVAFIEVKGAWTPTRWNDAPTAGRIDWLSKPCSRAYAEGAMCSLNSAAIREAADGATIRLWAVLVDRSSKLRKGDRVAEPVPLFG